MNPSSQNQSEALINIDSAYKRYLDACLQFNPGFNSSLSLLKTQSRNVLQTEFLVKLNEDIASIFNESLQAHTSANLSYQNYLSNQNNPVLAQQYLNESHSHCSIFNEKIAYLASPVPMGRRCIAALR